MLISELVESEEVILPTKIDLIGKLVYSEELFKYTVQDDNLGNFGEKVTSNNNMFKVAEFINSFKVSLKKILLIEILFFFFKLNL